MCREREVVMVEDCAHVMGSRSGRGEEGNCMMAGGGNGGTYDEGGEG